MIVTVPEPALKTATFCCQFESWRCRTEVGPRVADPVAGAAGDGAGGARVRTVPVLQRRTAAHDEVDLIWNRSLNGELRSGESGGQGSQAQRTAGQQRRCS